MSVLDWLAHRSGRERVLLAVLSAIALPLAVGLGLLLPLAEQRVQAKAALDEAQALNLWVAQRAAETPVALAQTAVVAQTDPIGLSALEESLKRARLRDAVTRLDTRSEGGITLEFDAVHFIDLMQWIDVMRPGWGYQIGALRIEPTDKPAFVLAVLTLEAAG